MWYRNYYLLSSVLVRNPPQDLPSGLLNSRWRSWQVKFPWYTPGQREAKGTREKPAHNCNSNCQNWFIKRKGQLMISRPVRGNAASQECGLTQTRQDSPAGHLHLPAPVFIPSCTLHTNTKVLCKKETSTHTEQNMVIPNRKSSRQGKSYIVL